MTIEDAQGISQYLAEFEFPYSYLTSLQFAPFRGIADLHKLKLEASRNDRGTGYLQSQKY